MDDLKSILEDLGKRVKDNFLSNILIGFLIFNYKFIYILLTQENTAELPTSGKIVDEAIHYLNIWAPIAYAAFMSLVYPFISILIVKWRQFSEYCKNRWLLKSYPSNDQYQERLKEINELNTRYNDSITNLGRRFILECEKHLGKEWEFNLLRSAPNSVFYEDDFVATKDIGGTIKIVNLKHYNEKRQLKYVYLKLDPDTYIVADINDRTFQPKNFLDGNYEYMILTKSKPIYCSKSDFDEIYKKHAHEVIFTISKNDQGLYQHITWP